MMSCTYIYYKWLGEWMGGRMGWNGMESMDNGLSVPVG